MEKMQYAKIGAALVLVAGATLSVAADTRQMPMQGMAGQHHGMMGCPMMSGGMGGGMMGSRGMHALPPGNEKLQLQMNAEIMQKVGEIMAKYAAQVQTR
jgi:hypothetical protein